MTKSHHHHHLESTWRNFLRHYVLQTRAPSSRVIHQVLRSAWKQAIAKPLLCTRENVQILKSSHRHSSRASGERKKKESYTSHRYEPLSALPQQLRTQFTWVDNWKVTFSSAVCPERWLCKNCPQVLKDIEETFSKFSITKFTQIRSYKQDPLFLKRRGYIFYVIKITTKKPLSEYDPTWQLSWNSTLNSFFSDFFSLRDFSTHQAIFFTTD